MIERSFGLSSEDGKSKYKFKFCSSCEFYECELISEYENFKKNHSPLCESIEQSAYAESSNSQSETFKIMVTLLTDKDENLSEYCPSAEDFLSYDHEKEQNDCMMSFRHVSQVECGRKKVSDGIGDHYKIEIQENLKIKKDDKNHWGPRQPVFISAQTGQGKNWFIENTLIPYVRELNLRNNTNQRILILSNRLALKEQIKRRLNKNGDGDDENIIYPYKSDGAYADVMTYQGILYQKNALIQRQKNPRTRYIYVICDEAHFFTSDAMFNPHTQKILQTIVETFRHAIRVYMSATPYECIEYILKCENDYRDRLNERKSEDKQVHSSMVFYHFQRDYSYLNINVYSSIDELHEIIISSIITKKEKWLLFIDNKKKCQDVKAKLEKCWKAQNGHLEQQNIDSEREVNPIGIKILTVDATSKNDEEYISMVLKEELGRDTYVLISTSVLDNGINLKNVNNIVVSDMSKVKCLQMVGRARITNRNDQKNLYIKRFDEKYVDKRIKELKAQQDAYHDYSSGCHMYRFYEKYFTGDVQDWENAKHWFAWSHSYPSTLYFNEIAKSLADRYVLQYQFIYDEMMWENNQETNESKELESRNFCGQKYLEHQLSWFGKTYCEDNDITLTNGEKNKKELIVFLKSYAENESRINKDEQSESRSKFTNLSDAAFGRKDRNKNRDYSITKINSILEEESINYQLASCSSHWVVKEYDWYKEDSDS